MPDTNPNLQAIFQAFPDLLFVLDGDGTIVDYKAGDSQSQYHEPGPFIGRRIQEVVPSEVAESFEDALKRAGQHNETVSVDYRLPVQGKQAWFEARLVGLPHGQIATFVRDITARKAGELTIHRELDRMSALRAIDMAIASSLDLKLTLSILIDQVRGQLHVDAACILLPDSKSQNFTFATGKGFHTLALQHSSLKVGEGYAGRAALTQQVVRVTNLQNRQAGFERSPDFEREGFVEYFGVPLIAKGRVLGVLEIFHRSRLTPKADWLDFMEMLAGQAAIAIESANMFNDFERTNTALTLAYDATIEGWSRALELRDHETQGHTQRVTEMTVRLATMLGMTQEQILHIRRGAMLHDIGKMAIPDEVLFKAGPLDAGEWDLMQRHTSIAVDLLKPIHYLSAALDIPHYHHEKWDGSGYPNGLKEEQIPLAARLFSIVDVYDALTSNRPYRKAWSHEKALSYIQAESGRHFDPKVVEAFSRMMEMPAID